jgi:hypothetical protein
MPSNDSKMPLPPYGMESGFDFGDDLVSEIIQLVQKSPLPAIRKVKALVRAGKVGEMYLGICGGDGALQKAFTSSGETDPSLAKE